MTDFTHVHLPLVSDYSRVLRAWQDSLASITCITGFTCEYYAHNKIHSRVFSYYSWVESAWQELFVSIFTHQQLLTSSVLLILHEPNMWVVFKISQGKKVLLAFFCKLGRVLYHSYTIAWSFFIPIQKYKYMIVILINYQSYISAM